MADFNVSLALKAQDQGFSAEIKQSSGELKALAGDAKSAGTAIAKEISGATSGAQITRGVTSWRDTWNKASGSIRHGIGNIGLQLQDVFVQLQGGANPLTVIAQQGSQIAGQFGPTGAIVGAILAGVTLGIGALLRLSKDGFAVAESAVKNLEAALDEANRALGEGATEADKLVKAYSGLSGTTQGLGVVKIREDLIDTRRETEAATKAFGGLVDEMESAAELRLALGGSGLTDMRGLAGQLTRGQAEELHAAVAGFERGGLTDVQLLSEVQRVLADTTAEAREFVRQLIEVADKAETGRVSLEALAEAAPQIEALAAEGGVSLQKLGGSIDQVGERVERNKGVWADWYDAIVGQSYVPDMVTESEIWFDRLSTSMTSTTREATTNVADAFIGLDRQISGTLARMITSNKLALSDFADFALDISTSVLQNILQIGIQAGIGWAFAPSTAAPATGPGGLLVGGGVTSAGVGHEGGIAGDLARQRMVPASLFAHAERYHGGGMVLHPGEVPIIAQRGERITPDGQAAAPTTIVNIENHSGGQVEHRQSRGLRGQDVHQVIIRKVGDSIASGNQDRAMYARFGIRPVGR
jgi:hypothetical protein